jgi:hypothetical protein
MPSSIGSLAYLLFAPEVFVIAEATKGGVFSAIFQGIVVNTLWILWGYLFWTIIVVGVDRFLKNSSQDHALVKFLRKVLERTSRSKQARAKKVVAFIGNHKYSLLFFLNLIPFAPYVSTATILSLRLSKIPEGLLMVIAGGSTKIFLLAVIARFLCSL